jgi:glucose/arabinose dehydrogenase
MRAGRRTIRGRSFGAARWAILREPTARVFGSVPSQLLAIATGALSSLSPGASPITLHGQRALRPAVVARGLGHPTNLAFDSHRGLWATSATGYPTPTNGVWYVRAAGARPVHVVHGLKTALGLVWRGRELYVASVTVPGRTGAVTAYSKFDGSRFHRRRVVVRNLPVGLHNLDSIVPGPGGRLYLGVGSRSDHTRSPQRLSGTVISFKLDGSGLRVEARGLRNPYGLAFVPGTSDLLVTDNGRDDLGLFAPPDEINLVRVGRRPRSFGFPGCYGQGGRACRGAVPPLVRLAPHAAAGAIAVVPRLGRFGLSAYVAQNGSSFAGEPTGNDVIRVSLSRRRSGGYTVKAHPFATGFEDHDPLAVALGPDGHLYLGLFSSSALIRVAPERLRGSRPSGGSTG